MCQGQPSTAPPLSGNPSTRPSGSEKKPLASSVDRHGYPLTPGGNLVAGLRGYRGAGHAGDENQLQAAAIGAPHPLGHWPRSKRGDRVRSPWGESGEPAPTAPVWFRLRPASSVCETRGFAVFAQSLHAWQGAARPQYSADSSVRGGQRRWRRPEITPVEPELVHTSVGKRQRRPAPSLTIALHAVPSRAAFCVPARCPSTVPNAERLARKASRHVQ